MNDKLFLGCERKIFIFLFLSSFFFTVLVSGQTPSLYQDCDIYGNCRIPTTGVDFNNNTAFVNNSAFLQGLTPQQVANLYSETDPLSLRLDGSNANQNIDIGIYDFKATNLIAEVGTESITLTGDHINYESSGGGNNFHFQGDDIAWLGADFYINNFRFINNIISNSGGTISFSNENLEIDADAKTFCFGASQDGCIKYDNTDLIIDPDVVGSGKVLIGATGDDDLEANHSEFTFLNVTDLSTLDGGISIKPTGDTAITPIDVNIDFNSNIPSAIMNFDSTLKDFLSNARMINLVMYDVVPTDDTLRRYEAIGFTLTPQLFVAGTPADTREYFGANWQFNAGGTVVGSADFTTTGLKMDKKGDLNFGSGTFNQRGIDLRGWGLGTGINEQYAIYSNGGDWVLDHDGSTGKMYFGDTQETEVYQSGTDFIINATSTKVLGNLNQTNGNATINMIYGELHGVDIGDVVINTQNVYENITNVTSGHVNGFTFSGGGLIVNYPGVYTINGGYSFSGIANTEFHLALGVNGEKTSNCHSERKIGSGGDVGNAGFTCLDSWVTGDNITVMIENADSTTNPTIHDINLNLVRIGNL